MFVDLCIVFQAGAVGHAPGPQLWPNTDQKLMKHKIYILVSCSESKQVQGGRHDMALELVCRADFWCNGYYKTSLVDLEWFGGQFWLKIDSNRPTQEQLKFIF